LATFGRKLKTALEIILLNSTELSTPALTYDVLLDDDDNYY